MEKFKEQYKIIEQTHSMPISKLQNVDANMMGGLLTLFFHFFQRYLAFKSIINLRLKEQLDIRLVLMAVCIGARS